MNSENFFGAGIFENPPEPKASHAEETRSHRESNDPEEEQRESSEGLETPEEIEDSEYLSKEIDEDDSQEYFLQQERDREKALLLRRSREGVVEEISDRPRGRSSSLHKSRPPFVSSGKRAPRYAASESSETASAPATKSAEQHFEPTSTGVLLDQRVAILVDVQNMYHSARKIHGRNLAYSKLLGQTVRGRKLIRAIAYLLDREGVDQAAFLEHLGNCGFELRRKNLIERADGSRKGDWDLGIAADAIALAKKVDVIILVSGDGDFISLAQMLKHEGVKVEVASFRESTADALFNCADGFHALGKETLYD